MSEDGSLTELTECTEIDSQGPCRRLSLMLTTRSLHSLEAPGFVPQTRNYDAASSGRGEYVFL